MIAAGNAFTFDLFYNTNFLVLWMFFWLFSISMVNVGFLLSTMINNRTKAYVISYSFALFTFVLELALANRPLLLGLFFPVDLGIGWIIVRTILYIFPPFTYSVLFSQIASIGATHFESKYQTFVPGRKMVWSDLVNHDVGFLITGVKYDVPPIINIFGILILDIFIYLILTWYFDHVIQSNRGTNESWYFPVTKKYWGSFSCCKRKRFKTKLHQHRTDNSANIQKQLDSVNDINTVDSVTEEKQKVLEHLRNLNLGIGESATAEIPTLIIAGIQKYFRKYQFGIKSKKDNHAVKGVYLGVYDRELFSILGHNGAGKTTLINILTGILAPSSGTAKICGFDIVDEVSQCRKLLGIVPQFDILWDELTAEEHMKMFCKIKGVPADQIDKLIKSRLKSMSLYDVIKAQVKTFSGGMKRRLSVALGTIGDPPVIFMDEPTTGMDPVSRRKAWNVIRKIKRSSTVILTTHSMEEADILSDKIGVIVDGQFKCFGTPLYLKNEFGEGYRINLVTDPDNVSEVRELMQEIIPSSTLVDESGGSLIFSVPISKITEISPMFKLIQKDSVITNPRINELQDLIIDCGISQTTLEEVFMKVTGKKIAKVKSPDVVNEQILDRTISDEF
jgi:ABC-type multidrug transport system ATPase subunit